MQKNRRPSKRVRSALAQAVKKYGVTFMGEFLYCSRTFLLSTISGESNPNSRSAEIISKWYLHRKNDQKAYQIWCQYKNGLRHLASINKEIKWIRGMDIFKNVFPESWDEFNRALVVARKAARSRMSDELYDLKNK